MQPWHRRSAIWPGCSRTAMRTPPTNSLSRCRTKELPVNISFRRTPTPHCPLSPYTLSFPPHWGGRKYVNILHFTCKLVRQGYPASPAHFSHKKNFIEFVVPTNRHPVEDLYEVTAVAAETRNMQFNSQSLPHSSNRLFHPPLQPPHTSTLPYSPMTAVLRLMTWWLLELPVWEEGLSERLSARLEAKCFRFVFQKRRRKKNAEKFYNYQNM